MPNKPDIYKRMVHFRLDRELYEKTKKIARARNCSVTEVLIGWIVIGTLNIDLTPEDHENITRQIREAEGARREKH